MTGSVNASREGKSLKEKKRLAGILAAAAAGMALLGTVLAVWLGRGSRGLTPVVYTWQGGGLTLKDIAYDRPEEDSSKEDPSKEDPSEGDPVVYIRENGEYVPYLVLTADYGGNVLLLREHLLPEAMQYEPSPHGDGFWAGELSSYYEESSIDAFLNTDFLEVFCPEVRAAILDTWIEVTDEECYEEWNYATHMIQRKVFLLSSVELGETHSVGRVMAKEGEPLKYFKNAEHAVRRAYMANGEAWPYWTRTPWLWETYLVKMIGVNVVGDVPADSRMGVRPAFCMERDTKIRESDGIVPGETVYVLEVEED